MPSEPGNSPETAITPDDSLDLVNRLEQSCVRVLAVDIGNTQTVIGWFEDDVLRCTARWGTVREDADDLMDRELSGFFDRYNLNPGQLDAIGIASVVPPATPQLLKP